MIQVHSHTSLIPNSTKAIVTLAAICSLSLAACSVTALGEESHFIRHSDKAPGIIVFVHGLFGDSVSTWTNKDTKAYFPKLLTQDPIFDGWNIYAVQYPSPIINSTLSIDELADTVRSDLESIDLLGYDNVVFISHSLGGLVTRAFLTKYRDYNSKVKLLYFFATPTSGADIANWGIWITHLLANRNLQIEELQKMTSGSYLLDRVSDWLAAKFPFPSYCAYETVKTDGVLVVSSASALLLATERPDPINEDHITIVQPKDAKARAYIDFRNAFVRTIKGNSGINSHSAVSITVIPALPERHPGPSTQALISPPSEGTEPAVTNETPAAQTDENLYTVRYEYERTNHGFLISYRLPYLDLLQRGDPVIGKKYDKNPFLSEWPQLLTTVANNSARQVVITSVVLDIAKSYQRDDVILTVDDSSLNTLIFVNHGWGDVINPRLIFEVHRPQTSTPDFNSEKHELDLPAFKASHVVQIHKYIPQTMTQLDFVHVVGELQYGSNDDRRTLKFSTNVEQNAHFGAPLTPSDEEYGVFFKSGETGRFVVDLQVPRQIKPGEADTFYLRVGTDRSSLTQTNLGFLTNEGTEIEANELTLDLFVPRFADVKWQQGIIRKEK